MRSPRWTTARAHRWIGLALVLALSGALIASTDSARRAPATAQATARLEATIFTYDGQDFVRAKTTLVTEAGEPAVNTKLDRNTPAYEALMRKRSYTGDATVFGRTYEANYAPLTTEDGRLTGALFVAVPK